MILAELATLRRWRRAMVAFVVASPAVLFGFYKLPWRTWREILMLIWMIVVTVPLARTVLSPLPIPVFLHSILDQTLGACLHSLRPTIVIAEESISSFDLSACYVMKRKR